MHQGRIVDGRGALRQHGDAGDAPRRSGGRRAGDGLAVLEARLAERGAQIHQARGEDRALSLDDGGTVRPAEILPEIGDDAALDQHFALDQRLSGFVQILDFAE